MVADHRRRGRARRAASNVSASSSPAVERGLDLVPRDRRRHRRPVARCAASTRTPSSCAGRSGSSRRTPCPCRSAFAMSTVHALRVACHRAADRARARTLGLFVRRPWRFRSVAAAPRGAAPCRPTSSRPRSARDGRAVSRSSSATRQQSSDVGGRAGVEIEHHRAGVSRSGERPLVRVQLERGEVREPHERREVLDDAAFAAAVRLERLRCPDPVGMVRRAALLEEPLALRRRRAPGRGSVAGRRGAGGSPARSGGSSR